MDPLGPKPVGNGERLVVQAVQPTTMPNAADRANGARPGPEVVTVARDRVDAPPIDTARVAQLRQAVRDGTFSIQPAAIADRLIALQAEWNSQ